jgi:hypothetical protein
MLSSFAQNQAIAKIAMIAKIDNLKQPDGVGRR